MGLGLSELAQAVSFIGMDITEILGQTENVTRLYNAFRAFFQRAYDSILALLGQHLADTLGQQVLDWVKEMKEGASLRDILERFYQTAQTAEHLQPLVDNSTAQLERFITAIQSMSQLDSAYDKQIKWAERTLKVLKWFGTISAAALPQGELLIATFCITLGAYIIFVGADYVDSPNLTLLDCIPGVHHIVENNLAPEAI